MEIEINKSKVVANIQKPVILKFSMWQNNGADLKPKWYGSIVYEIRNENDEVVKNNSIELSGENWNNFATNFDTFSKLMKIVFEKENFNEVIPVSYENTFYNL